MSYLWEKFNVKTFPARTIVFADGEFRADLSEQSSKCKVQSSNNNAQINIHEKTDLPVHIIYIGEIAGEQEIKIINSAEDSQIFITAKLNVKKPAFLNVFIENAGENSEINGNFVFLNESTLKFNVFADHLAQNTGVFVQNRVLAQSKTSTDLSGSAKIMGNCPGCKSDISFAAMCAPDIKHIKMSPNQRIANVPIEARHSAGIYRGTEGQIQFLTQAGLNRTEVDRILAEAFLE
ncbi:MAG: SufD family Fe-S cluster assembly protein [Alphaproteobacteria bacterium]|nr:SufD family Fe-S cluster assembly protein [Alphaproteobacteria bacterium]